jgi:hypothetical protein
MKNETPRIYILDYIPDSIPGSPYGDDLNPPTHKKARSLPQRAWHIGWSLLPWLVYVVLLAALPLAIEKNFGSHDLLFYYIPCLFVIGFATLGLAVLRHRR